MDRRRFLALHTRMTNLYRPQWHRLLRQQIRYIADIVRSDGIPAAQAVLSRPKFYNDMLQANYSLLYRQYVDVGSRFADQQNKQFEQWDREDRKQGGLAKAFGFSSTWGRLITFIFDSIGAAKVQKISNTTRDYLNTQLQNAVANEMDRFDLARELVTTDVPLQRAQVIAQTESTAAAGIGQMTAARSARFQMLKIWNNVNDSRVRETHQDGAGVGGERQELETQFSNGCMQPGDPHGLAREVVRCRCSISFEPKRDENGRLIRL